MSNIETNIDWDDKKQVRSAVRKACVLHHASDRLKDDDDVALSAIRASPIQLIEVSERLKNDQEFLLKGIASQAKVYRYLTDAQKADEDFLIKALEVKPEVKKYITDELKREIGNTDPLKFLKARKLYEKLTPEIEQKYGIAPEYEPAKPRFKI
ncbi:DUF4116 domain-containing protein [Paraburkholderia aromaticivorans]|uniref:DUF4116 domain-containing protein n=1 Tax=Paraburkholderia aromaticivorans TaxID=2026199 RepID=UPI0038B84B0C